MLPAESGAITSLPQNVYPRVLPEIQGHNPISIITGVLSKLIHTLGLSDNFCCLCIHSEHLLLLQASHPYDWRMSSNFTLWKGSFIFALSKCTFVTIVSPFQMHPLYHKHWAWEHSTWSNTTCNFFPLSLLFDSMQHLCPPKPSSLIKVFWSPYLPIPFSNKYFGETLQRTPLVGQRDTRYDAKQRPSKCSHYKEGEIW
jgi:hypothetical protein